MPEPSNGYQHVMGHADNRWNMLYPGFSCCYHPRRQTHVCIQRAQVAHAHWFVKDVCTALSRCAYTAAHGRHQDCHVMAYRAVLEVENMLRLWGV